jgi:hypothetical protein
MEIDWMNNAECPTEEEYFKAAVRSKYYRVTIND